MVDKKFIKNLQGKEFVLFEGLLNEFHKAGGKSIKTEIIKDDPFIIQATVEGTKGTFQGIGDANDKNVGALVAKHKIRMAETRGIARALRWYCNIGMCTVEELGGDDKKNEVLSKNNCSKCGVPISDKVSKYSMENWGKPFCMAHQDKLKEREAEQANG